MTPCLSNDKSTLVRIININGRVGMVDVYGDASSGVSPAVYLKSNVKIISGTGEPGNPFQLSI